ncbi:MAG: HEPN domain-containing protein [Acidobacteria bacterium]|nr:HEPN domain-containing protein [Acidobacteriota bacterium]
MSKTKRKTIEGWIDKASNQLDAAREHVKSFRRCSEAIQAAQQCVELSVKSILSLLDVHYSRSHEWAPDKKEFAAIAEQIQHRRLLEGLVDQHLEGTVRLPRLLFLLNFWAQFYITAKYGFEAEHLASAQDLFEREEAELAVRHAEECLRAATNLRFLDGEKLAALVSKQAA